MIKNAFTHLFDKYLLCIYYVQGLVLDPKDITGARPTPSPGGADIFMGKQHTCKQRRNSIFSASDEVLGRKIQTGKEGARN